MKLSAESIDTFASVLAARAESLGSDVVLHIEPASGGGRVALTLSTVTGDHVVVSAQTVHGYFELHNLVRWVPVEPGEIIFVAEEGDRISGLVVGREGTCSLFANVDRTTLSADFAELEPALLLAAMQLGLAENIPG